MDNENKNSERPDIEIAALRLAGSEGNAPRFWRGLEELADTTRIRDHKENEFPHGANDPEAKLNRRELMKVMAASAAFAGLTGCTKLPTQKIVPLVHSRTNCSRKTAFLCDSRDSRPRPRHRRPGRKPHGSPHQGRGESRSPGQPWRERRVCPRVPSWGFTVPMAPQAEIHDGRIGSWAEFQNELSSALGAKEEAAAPAFVWSPRTTLGLPH